MKFIKTVLIMALLGTTLLLANGNKFEERKSITVNHLTQKIELINTFKGCVERSSNQRAIKVCRESFKKSRLFLKAKTKAKRVALKARR